MAWLSGLADKAENLLNKIDKNTAAVLNKDKYELPHNHLSEVTWLSPDTGSNENHVARTPLLESSDISYLGPATNLTSLNLLNETRVKEDALFTYLNTPDLSPRRMAESVKSPSTTSSLLVECPTDDTASELSIHSDRISPTPTHVSIDVLDDKDTDVDDENTNLYSKPDEIEALDCKHLDQQTTKVYMQSEQSDNVEDSNVLNSLPEYKIEATEMETNHLNGTIDSIEDRSVQTFTRETEKCLEKRDELLEKQDTDHQKEIMILNEKLRALEAEKSEQSKQIMNLQFVIDRSRQEMNSIRSELEQHKARALRTLQEKEKLIVELRNNTSTAMDEAVIMELNQLKQERNNVKEENQQMCQQLRLLREELVNADLNLEKIRQKSAETNLQNQEVFTSERRRRLEAEEDARQHSEEIRSLKDELITQRNGFSLQLQKQDSEISRLRLQLSTSAIPSNEVDSRLASLTQTLIVKQQALECLTTERNALRLQLEKIEHEYRNAAGNLRRNMSYNNMNDTDDAKAQVPTFLMETPFDTSVTRRVKRAYSSLDAISIRTGVFLRRYPLARILILIYIALLQFWVLIVLLSQSPEAH